MWHWVYLQELFLSDYRMSRRKVIYHRNSSFERKYQSYFRMPSILHQSPADCFSPEQHMSCVPSSCEDRAHSRSHRLCPAWASPPFPKSGVATSLVTGTWCPTGWPALGYKCGVGFWVKIPVCHQLLGNREQQVAGGPVPKPEGSMTGLGPRRW